MAQVVLESVSKIYPGGSTAVDDLSLCVDDRELLVLVGPSGCGKTTLLRLIAGLEQVTAGRICIGDREVTRVAPKDRHMAMVFQDDAFLPHLSVRRNLSFGLDLRLGGNFGARVLRRLINPRWAAEWKRQQAGIDAQVQQAAERLGITSLLNRRPHQLSGGERQRVALGRALVRNPAAFLLDEPLAKLDPQRRHQLRVEIKDIQRTMAAATIYVTHDHVEAMSLGDRVAIMNQGRLLQVATPQTIYDRPQNLFVARFFGSLPMNLIPGRLARHATGLVFESGSLRWQVPVPLTNMFGNLRRSGVTVGVRPEDIHIVDAHRVDPARLPADQATLAARLSGLEQWEDVLIGRIDIPAEISGAPLRWYAKVPKEQLAATLGSSVVVSIRPEKWHWFDTETEQNLMN